MKYLLITNMYPKENNLYRNAFIHRRVKGYLEYNSNLEITVFVLNNKLEQINRYVFDSVKVIEGNKKILTKLVSEKNYDKLLVHFIDRHMMDVICRNNFDIPILVWVHGVEALGWYRRLFNFNVKEFPKYVVQNTRQMLKFKQFIKKSKEKNVTFIFVSNWMKKVLEKDTLEKIKNYEIIPNVIDTGLFKYNDKSPELRKKILLIRPFASKKYANDIAIKAIKYLSSWEHFSDLEFRIVGEGKYFKTLTSKLKKYKNIFIQNQFLSQYEIANIHKEYGVFLCPTRQDAQGVSMCEAMSSGLVPVTSNNTAIPEFVDKESGFLTNNPMEIAEAIKKLYKNPEMFNQMSKNASRKINVKCGKDNTIAKELELILKYD